MLEKKLPERMNNMSIVFFQDLINRTTKHYRAAKWTIEYQTATCIEYRDADNEQLQRFSFLPEDSRSITASFQQSVLGIYVEMNDETSFEYYMREEEGYLGICISVSENLFNVECRRFKKEWEHLSCSQLPIEKQERIKQLESIALEHVKSKKEYRLYDVMGMMQTLISY